MSTPVAIDFEGMDAQPAVRNAVVKQIVRFEKRFGPIAAGRVVLRSPKNGSIGEAPAPYEVNIEMSLLDGRNFFVGGGPQSGQRHADLNLAISDAFKWARTAAL